MVTGQKRMEVILYLVLWAILFAAPVVSVLVGDVFFSSATDAATASDQASSIDWNGVFNAWGLLAMFCVTFFLHNFLIAPLLVYGNRKWAYGISVAVLLVVFFAYQLACRPHHPEARPNGAPKPKMERTEEDMKNPVMAHELPDNTPGLRPVGGPGEPFAGEYGTPPSEGEGPRKPPQPRGEEGEDSHRKEMEPPRVFGGQDSVAFIIMALLLGLNVCTKYFFKSLDDKKKFKELERENLNRQLEYLKYQINPHFFMNTLNNIHALVDIDPEQAKHTIEVLSKLMRYALYEGNKTMAPLQKELDFIGHYMDLMKIRYTDKVRITLSLPPAVPDVQVPSLLFTTFVENAFKHGVSYQRESFIEVSVSVDEATQEIDFCCCNSRIPAAEDKHGGVGLQNAKKRLQLIYGDEYELNVISNEEEYRLLLRLPCR